ncbi:hypothetical protein niasHT_015111 [Heterodera trifolii]|uniref:Uncharacterized protein n=1 Tax=Heterodera trifolii TaxID=157864 RepID=A0ABD2L9T9_9BILA
MAKNSFYGRISVHDNLYIKLCPYHLTRKATPTPPWRIDHIQVEVPKASLTVNDIRVEQADPSDANESVWVDDTFQMEPKRIEWTRVKYLKINQTFGGTDDTFYVFVNVPLAKQLNASAWMRINLLNDALEVDNIFGTIVNQIYLYAGKWLSFDVREPDGQKAWRTIVNYTLGTMVQEEHSDTVTPNSGKQFELKFIIALNSAASTKIGVELQINGQHITSDIHGALLTCCPAAEAVQIDDIEYITPESANIEMLTDTDVEMNCIPADKCIFKT